MKKYWKLAVIPLVIFFVGTIISFCQERNAQESVGKTHIRFPFTAEHVEKIDVYYYTDLDAIEKYELRDEESICYLYDTFEMISLKDWSRKSENAAAVSAYRFTADDGTEYELIYEGYGVKNGKLTLLDTHMEFFTSADLNKLGISKHEPIAADASELPK